MHQCTLPTKGALVNIYVEHSDHERTVTQVDLINDTTIRSYELHYVEKVSTSS